jgi:hypothetical protein
MQIIAVGVQAQAVTTHVVYMDESGKTDFVKVANIHTRLNTPITAAQTIAQIEETLKAQEIELVYVEAE